MALSLHESSYAVPLLKKNRTFMVLFYQSFRLECPHILTGLCVALNTLLLCYSVSLLQKQIPSSLFYENNAARREWIAYNEPLSSGSIPICDTCEIVPFSISNEIHPSKVVIIQKFLFHNVIILDIPNSNTADNQNETKPFYPQVSLLHNVGPYFRESLPLLILFRFNTFANW